MLPLGQVIIINTSSFSFDLCGKFKLNEKIKKKLLKNFFFSQIGTLCVHALKCFNTEKLNMQYVEKILWLAESLK